MSTSAHQVLGVARDAGKDEVKEAFRKLCMKYHPDRCAPEFRVSAEHKFKEIKTAYESILRAQAGYAPPPPNSPPDASHARAWYASHTSDGRVPWGKYAGYQTELEFYKAMFRNSKSNVGVLTAAGLVAIPFITGIVYMGSNIVSGLLSGPQEIVDEVKRDAVMVNNPYAASRWKDSYVYKHEKYAHLREKYDAMANRQAKAAEDAE